MRYYSSFSMTPGTGQVPIFDPETPRLAGFGGAERKVPEKTPPKRGLSNVRES